jgi:RNA polymerase sigma factor (TIGR02999 family)
MADDLSRTSDDREISQLLAEWTNRQPAARDRLVALVYNELRGLARRHLRRERPEHTLQTTALVNEAYLRLVGLERMQWRDRAHFFAMTATLMRRVLVDYARERGREKRGGAVSVTSLDGHDLAGSASGIDVLTLDQALSELGAIDARQARIVDLRFFGGLTVEETAEALAISPATVKREWASARAWLYHQITRQ